MAPPSKQRKRPSKPLIEVLFRGLQLTSGRSRNLRGRAFGVNGRLLEPEKGKSMAKGREDLFLPAPVKEEIRFLVCRFTRSDRERFAE